MANKQKLDLNMTAVTTGGLMITEAAEKTVKEATTKLNVLDGLILNHAFSIYGEIGDYRQMVA